MRAGGVDRVWTTGPTSLSAVCSAPAIRAGVGLRASTCATTRCRPYVLNPRSSRGTDPAGPARSPSPRSTRDVDVGGGAGVASNLSDREIYLGMPAIKKKDFVNQILSLRRMETMFKDLMDLKNRFSAIETAGKKR